MKNSAYVIEIEQAEKETRRTMLNTRHKIATQITQITQLTNNWNELEDILKIKKARMLNEPDYSKYYLEGYETAIQTTHSSHSGIMLETAKNSIVVLCDELLDKMKEIKEGNNE